MSLSDDRFHSEQQGRCFAQLLKHVKTTFPEAVQVPLSIPALHIGMEHAVLMTGVHDFNDTVVIRSRCYLVRGARLNTALLTKLADDNAYRALGAFVVDRYGNVLLQHVSAGATWDVNLTTLFLLDCYHQCSAMAREIQQEYGGYLAADGANTYTI